MTTLTEAQSVSVPENLHEKRRRKTAEVLANHLLAETFARDEESGRSARSAVQELSCVQVLDASFWISAHTSEHRHRTAVSGESTLQQAGGSGPSPRFWLSTPSV